jgi:hypothetical protein
MRWKIGKNGENQWNKNLEFRENSKNKNDNF